MGGDAPGGLTEIRIETRGRVRVAKSGPEGLVMAEVYLPFDAVSFGEFQELVIANGGDYDAAAAAAPELAHKAMMPIDSHGEAMLAPDIKAMAFEFVERRAVDVQHDNEARPTVKVVQSFINDDLVASPHYWPGAWVLGVKVDTSSDEWAKIERGEIGAFSFQARVSKARVMVKISEGGDA